MAVSSSPEKQGISVRPFVFIFPRFSFSAGPDLLFSSIASLDVAFRVVGCCRWTLWQALVEAVGGDSKIYSNQRRTLAL